jgi:hypothetical protein
MEEDTGKASRLFVWGEAREFSKNPGEANAAAHPFEGSTLLSLERTDDVLNPAIGAPGRAPHPAERCGQDGNKLLNDSRSRHGVLPR